MNRTFSSSVIAAEIYKCAFKQKPDMPAGESYLIDYLGEAKTFPTIPIYRILKGEIKPEQFTGKIRS